MQDPTKECGILIEPCEIIEPSVENRMMIWVCSMMNYYVVDCMWYWNDFIDSSLPRNKVRQHWSSAGLRQTLGETGV